jgi:hypothetical protein
MAHCRRLFSDLRGHGILSDRKEEISVAACFFSGFGKMGSLSRIMLIPFMLDLINYIGFIATSSLLVFSIGVTFSTPVSFPSITDFYSFPNSYSGLLPFSINITSPLGLEGFLTLLPLIALTLAINSLLTGGFVGTIWEVVSGSEERKGFSYYAVNRLPSILGFRVFSMVTSFILLSSMNELVSYIGWSFEVFILVLLVSLFVGYILCLVPFIIVIENKNTIDSIGEGIRDAFTSRTAGYVVLYLIVSSLFSGLVYLLINIRFVGFLISMFVAAFVGTALVASTVDFYLSSHWSARPAQ